MKKILLVSDSHGRNDNLREVVRRVKPIDMMLHMGDVGRDEDEIRSFAGCPVEFVRGNCDWSREPNELELVIEGHRILMTHGHRYSVNYGYDMLDDTARERGAEIILFGHTHVPEYFEIGGRIFVNPGSISRPRQEGHKPSYGILEIDRQGKCHITINYLNYSR